MENQLSVTIHPDEQFWMTQIGHLNDLYPETDSIEVTITNAIDSYTLQENMRMLFAFRNMRALTLRMLSSSYNVDQHLLVSLAELIPLTKLELLCGTIPYDLEFHAISSLRNLKHLTILPYEEYGLVDDDVDVITAFKVLEELHIRPSSFGFTDASLIKLASLTNLHTLYLCPLSSSTTASGLLHLRALPKLHTLTIGLTRPSQALFVTALDFVPKLTINTLAQEIDISNLLSIANWCLPHNLSGLTLTPPPSIVLRDLFLSAANLTCLTSLKLTLPTPASSPSSPPNPPIPDVSLLTPLTCLRRLHLLPSRLSPVKVTVKSISLAAIAWPHLTSLTLACMGSAYLLPEALDLLDNFTSLKQLCLCSEIGTPDAADPSLRFPLNLEYLPSSLTHLSLELAQLTSTATSEHRVNSAPTTPLNMAQTTITTGTSNSATPQALGRASSSNTLVRVPSCGPPPLSLLPNLQGMELVDCSIDPPLAPLLLPSLPGLKYLDLADVDGLTDDTLQALPTLVRLTHLSIRGAASPNLSIAPFLTLPKICGLRHLEWCTPDTYQALDIGRLAPSLCLMTNLRFLSLATRAPAVRENGEGWWAVLQQYLPYCSFTLDPALEVTNPWEDCTSLS